MITILPINDLILLEVVAETLGVSVEEVNRVGGALEIFGTRVAGRTMIDAASAGRIVEAIQLKRRDESN